MATYQSSFGKVEVFEDFTGIDPDVTWAAGGFRIGNVSVVSVNEGSVEDTVDESGGVAAITLDTGDDDNVALYTSPFAISDGPLVMEARFKTDNVSDLALFVGFTETLDGTTPVMPAEFATATMTYNGTGGMVGLQFDSDGTTDDWRAVMGDGGAAKLDSSNGIRANSAAVADEYDIVRVEIDPSTAARVYLNGVVVKNFAAGGLTASDLFFPVLMCENRAGSAAVLEVDYFYSRGNRDWAE